jgi:hypothetical protein
MLPSTLYTYKPNHRNPLLRLACRLTLLFRFGISIPFSSAPLPLNSEPGLHVPLRLIAVPFSILNCFQPSSSLSSLKVFSLSSLSSRSALRALSWLAESLFCNSSIVLRNFSHRSRERAISSSSCVLALSRRSICNCRSLTVRSTLRTSRCDLFRWFSWASSWASSWGYELVKAVQ